MTTSTSTKRPTRRDESVRRTAAQNILPQVIEWLGNGYYNDDESVIRQLVEASQWDTDPFKVAKELDWDGDRSLVDLMDAFESAIDSSEREAVAAWVKDNPDLPRFKIGERVRWRNYEGEVVDSAYWESQAKVVVMCESEGHKRTGIGSGGFVCPVEDVQLIGDSDIRQPGA